MKDVDSDSSSNPIYHVRISEAVVSIITEVVGQIVDESDSTTHKRASDRLAKRTGS